MIAKKYIISGRVQGVGFRWFIKKIAETLDIKGYVMNLPNGDVEIWAECTEKSHDKLKYFILKGNGISFVENIKEEFVPPNGYTYFYIKH